MNSVDVSVEEDSGDAPEEEPLARFVQLVLGEIGVSDWELSVLLCGDERMRTLNRVFRGKDETTDVLTFSQLEGILPPGDNATIYVGDIVICLAQAGHNAVEFGVSREEELKRLIVHGVLHLAGFEHGDNSADQPMLREQEKILSYLTGERLF